MNEAHEIDMEKSRTVANAYPVAPSPPDEEQGRHHPPDRDVRNAIWAIFSGVALPCIPIIAITIVLLYFIFRHRVQPWSGYSDLSLTTDPKHQRGLSAFLGDVRHNGGRPAYLVAYNPSTLTTIASWTSRIIPYLSSSIMALVAFFAARYIVQQSKKGHDAVLPTPEQLTILIGLLGGSGIEPLKDTLFYKWLKKERLISPVPAVFWVLALITSLGLTIPVVDTWFGIATHPATITLLSNTTQAQKFGRQLDTFGQQPQCPQGPGTFVEDYDATTMSFWPCNLVNSNSMGNYVALANTIEATKLRLGLPVSTMLSNFTLSSREWVFYADPQQSSQLDFKASTPAISTQCTPITQKCTYNSFTNNGVNFTCTPGLRGTIDLPWPFVMYPEADTQNDTNSADDVGIAFAPDAQLSHTTPLKNLTANDWQAPEIVPQNPMYFMAYASGYPNANAHESPLLNPYDVKTQDYAYTGGGQIYYTGDEVHWFLNCSTLAANVTYTWVNGSIRSFSPQQASPEMAALFTGQWSLMGLDKGDILRALQTVATLASLANSSDDLAAKYAVEFSKASMALSLGAFVPIANELEQARQANVIVARVPLIPLYILLGLKLLYVIAVMVLAIGAYAFTHPAETEVVKAQLSAKGLAAAHFDQPALVQNNVVRQVQSRIDVAMARSNTGKMDPASGNVEGGGGQNGEPVPGLVKRATSSPADLAGGKAKVGLVPNAEGMWKFVILADGVWHSIEPIVKTFVENEAKTGAMGEVGNVINAWK